MDKYSYWVYKGIFQAWSCGDKWTHLEIHSFFQRKCFWLLIPHREHPGQVQWPMYYVIKTKTAIQQVWKWNCNEWLEIKALSWLHTWQQSFAVWALDLPDNDQRNEIHQESHNCHVGDPVGVVRPESPALHFPIGELPFPKNNQSGYGKQEGEAPGHSNKHFCLPFCVTESNRQCQWGCWWEWTLAALLTERQGGGRSSVKKENFRLQLAGAEKTSKEKKDFIFFSW